MYYSVISLLALLTLLMENQDILLNRECAFDKPAWKVYRKFLFAVMVYYITDILIQLHLFKELIQRLSAPTAGNGEQHPFSIKSLNGFNDMWKHGYYSRLIVLKEQSSVGFSTAIPHFIAHRYQFQESLLERQSYHRGTLFFCAMRQMKFSDGLLHGLHDEASCVAHGSIKVQYHCSILHI